MADESIPVRSSSQKADEKTAAKGATAPESTAADVGTTEPAADAAKDTEMKDTEEKPADETKTEKESVAEDSGSKPAEADAEQKKTDTGAESETNEEKPAEKETDSQAQDDTAASADASAKGRRKSTAADNKAKTLKKKASKAKVLNLDAKPGDHFFAKLKGFPPWPVVICAEDMLPKNMSSSRPVTAAREDGTYRDDFADGGRRVADRTFPVMYLYTNEFSWTPNTDLSELDHETVADMITSKMRKDLQKAHELASENNDLQYYRDLLQKFEEEREQARVEKEEKAKAKAAAAAEKKAKTSVKPAKTPKKSKASVDEDGDMDMEDIGDDDDVPKSKAKKRKAEDASEQTPQRTDSVKKPKIKLTSSSTPKANGAASPKDSSSKTLKVKAKPKKAEPPKEPELSPEEKKERKQKEILFLRHRLQKGLLNRTAPPQEDEMKSMSEFLGKLETFPDLEADIIKQPRSTKFLRPCLNLTLFRRMMSSNSRRALRRS